jgi:hypothetical protein
VSAMTYCPRISQLRVTILIVTIVQFNYYRLDNSKTVDYRQAQSKKYEEKRKINKYKKK